MQPPHLSDSNTLNHVNNYFQPGKDLLYSPSTGSSKEVLLKIGEAISSIPADVELHPGLVRILNTRKEMIEKNSVDWAIGESFAFASLIQVSRGQETKCKLSTKELQHFKETSSPNGMS